ncbi:hypothetical protein SLA2020_418180 [Shorea laevis]
MTATFRMLAYGVLADYVDEYVRIVESIAIKSLEKFVQAVVSIYSNDYLRFPNVNGVARLLEVGKRCGFPGMLGALNTCIRNGRIAELCGKGMPLQPITQSIVITTQ